MAAADGHLRVSHAERDQVIEALRQHTADGRLTMDEFEERVGEALAATTRDDLAPVLRNLPPLEPRVVDASTRRPPISLPTGRSLTLAAVVVIAVVLVSQGAWWVVFPLVFAFGGCGRAGSCSTRRVRDRQARGTDAHDRELINV